MTRPLVLQIDTQALLPRKVCEVLEQDGYEVAHTADPERVMQLVESRCPTLVVMEIAFEGCEGLDLMAGVRDAREGSIPVLVLTDLPRDSAEHAEAIALGCLDFLTKPAKEGALLATIREVVSPMPGGAGAAKPVEAPALAGDLADAPMPELLARLRRRGANGVLRVGDGDVEVGVQLRNGSPVGVSSGDHSEDAADCLYETFRWLEGAYEFTEGERLEPDAMLELSEDPAGLLLAGVLDASPDVLIRDRLRKRESLYVCVTVESEAALEAEGVGFTPRQRQLFRGLAGESTLSVLLNSEEFEDRLVYALWVGGWLELRTAPTLTLTELLGDMAEPELEMPEPLPNHRERELAEIRRTRVEGERELAKLSRVRAERERELDELARTREQRERELEELALAREEREREHEALAPELAERTQELAKLERARERRARELKALARMRDKHENELEELARAREASAREHEQMAPALAERAQELATLEEARADRARELDEIMRIREEHQREVEDLARARENHARDVAALGRELKALMRVRDEHEEELAELAEARAEHALELEELGRARARQAEEIEELSRARAEQERELEALQRAREEHLSADRPAPIPDERDVPISEEQAEAAVPDESSIEEIAPPASVDTEPQHGEIAIVGEVKPPKRERDPVASALRELAEQMLAARDDFEVLGVTPTASDQQVYTAFRDLLQQVPDIESAPATLVLAQKGERIRGRIQAAYANLQTEDKRRAYSLLRAEEEQDRKAKPSAERALEGERWFRKGQTHLDQKRCDEAIEAFGMAAHLDPEQGEYASHLGYSLFLSNPGDAVVQREAMEHLAAGIKRSPDHEGSYVFLGRVLRAKGDVEAAKKIFQKALRIKPGFHPAVQELRVLEMREQKKKGVLTRLIGR